MRKISVGLLSPGLKVGRAVYDSQGRTLLNTGVKLTRKYIRRLKELGIPGVYIDDGLLPDLQVKDVVSEQTRVWAKQQVKNFFVSLEFQQGTQSYAEMKDLTKEVVDCLLDDILSNKSTIVNLADIRSHDEYTFGHSVNVCVLALLTGISLKFSRAKLSQLGMAALLHDIGKSCVPLSILNKPGKLTDEEFAEIKKHTVQGYQIILEKSGLGKLCALVALQHHERYNGQGYPQGLSGKEIHQYAGITGMVDMYDALTSERVYRKAYPAHEAFEMILGSGNFLFDFRLLKAFLDNVAAYQTGTLVKLNTGEVAVVLETKKGASLYPKVRILFDSRGRPTREKLEISLTDYKGVYIAEVIEDYRALQMVEALNES